MFSIEIFGFIGGALGIFFGLPQALRVRRLGHGRGVSLISWLLQLGVATSWAAYGFDKNSPSLLATNMAAGIINASVVWAILDNRLRATFAIATLVAVVAGLVLTLPTGLASALLISLVFAQSPQVYKSFKNIRIGKESAVSVVAMSVSAMSGIFWIIYAVKISDSLLVLCNAIVLSNNIAIIALEIVGKRSRALNAA
ncbi:unannotated protein [freshwater metagenome]|uniref:Unannotated protein n=1 Tax=freshwater metagenome TaxID=449393 RepID=A0A6J6X2V2_9ZZZZ|nr:hypothetical protein [Actinomycetota bacterium]